MEFPKNFSRQPRRRNWWLVLAIVFAVVVLIMLPTVAYFTTDWFWFRELGRTDVFWTYTWGPWLFGGLVALGFFLVVFGNVYVALRGTSEYLWTDLRRRLHARDFEIIDRTLRRVAVWGSASLALVFALVVGRSVAQYWSKALLFLHTQPLGSPDPVFGMDLSFYLFRLPVWQLLSTLLFSALIVALIFTGIVYMMTRTIRTVRGLPVFAPEVQTHLSILLAAIFIAKAAQYYLGRFTIMYAQHGDIVGPGYADMHARIPGLTIMAVLALVAAVFMIVNVRRRNILLPICGLVTLILACILLLGVYPALVQRFRVEPNELTFETPYITRHIEWTRRAYGLDKITERNFATAPRVSSEDMGMAQTTLSNTRLWDYRPLLQVYSQRQALRTYYDIANIDIDRYRINGRMRQVMLAGRELNVKNLPGQNTWQNQHLIYTHGYGVVMSPVNEVDINRGEPTFFIRDIPPKSSVPELAVTRPEIYFGELAGDYIIVRSNQQEFDYTRSDDTSAYTTYEGKAGIPLRNPLVRLLAATRFGAVNVLISSNITPQSRLIFRRQIVERAQALAPFLQFDSDPYQVIGDDGKLYWLLDAYTGSGSYPYSRYADVKVNGGTTELNYLRNPVKVVIDAYNGSTSFYLSDPQEPFIRAWQRIFPGMFKPLSEMPAGLNAHLRVPEGMFNTLSEVYRRYHMTNSRTFYQQEDLWDIPQESAEMTAGSAQADMEAYYIAMTLPGEETPEYLLIRPYSPKGKTNMVAWLSARNDPEHYGQLLVYNFSKQSQVFGPVQIQASINQDPDISSAVSLWNQSGSKVLLGNLLVMPIGKSILYVQPLYLQAEQSQIPELQRVIVADQQRVVMRRTLPEALAALTGSSSPLTPTTTPTLTPPVKPTPVAGENPPPLARTALEHFKRAESAQKQGDWATYGREMDAARRDLEELNNEKQ